MNLTMIIFWGVLMVVSFLYPILLKWVNHSIYLSFICLTCVLLIIYLPETKDKTLDEIEIIMLKKKEVM